VSPEARTTHHHFRTDRRSQACPGPRPTLSTRLGHGSPPRLTTNHGGTEQGRLGEWVSQKRPMTSSNTTAKRRWPAGLWLCHTGTLRKRAAALVGSKAALQPGNRHRQHGSRGQGQRSNHSRRPSGAAEEVCSSRAPWLNSITGAAATNAYHPAAGPGPDARRLPTASGPKRQSPRPHRADADQVDHLGEHQALERAMVRARSQIGAAMALPPEKGR